MRNIRIILYGILLLSGILLLTGCMGQPEPDLSDENAILLYYLNKEESGLYEKVYILEHPDDPEAAAKEVIFHLTDTEEDNAEEYKASIYPGIIPPTVEIDEDMAILDFETNYQQLSPEKEILLRTSLVQTLVQIKGIDSVTFTVNGSSLTGEDDKAIGVMTADTFVMSRKDLYTIKQKATLYYSNQEGDALIGVEKDIDESDNVPLETGLLQALIEPGPEGTKSPLPPDLTIIETHVYNGVCYVDLGSEIEEIIPELEDRIKVYSIVNTLTEQGNAKQVQFTIEGKKQEKLNDFEGFDELMTRDYSLIENGEEEEKDSEDLSEESDSTLKEQ